MSVEVIERNAWTVFCDRLSPLLVGQQAEVEVASLGLGDQIAAEWTPIVGFSYDPKDDLFSVALSGLDHLIHRPRTLAAQRRGPAVESLAVTDGEGTLHVVRFREPPMFSHSPPPEA
ncbi:MAG TPA: DUF5335 domain-containing protein [Caulobacteraceae bacterium]|jgi:hypothetical protein|nr:DUF5335 domain-containing protein [Caulobacteraceae bacterium]